VCSSDLIPGMDIGNYQHERLRQAIVARGYVIIGSMHTGGGPPVTLYARPDYAHSHAVTAIQAFIAEVNR